MRLSRPERAKVGHSLTAFLKPWICWAWGSLGARPLVWISVSTFLVPSFSSIAWPSAPERLRGFSSALKCSPCSWFPCSCFPCSSWLSRSSRSPPLAKATETRLSDMATASSSASPSFFDKTFSFLCSFIYIAFPTTTVLSPLPFSASPVALPFYLRCSRAKRIQRSSAPITCLPVRLVGPEPEGIGGGSVLCGLSHRAARGLIWRVQAPRSHHRLHEVVSVHAQEADLHADPNLRQRIEHDPSDMGAGPVEDRDELPRCGLPDLPPLLDRLEPEEHLGFLLEAEHR